MNRVGLILDHPGTHFGPCETVLELIWDRLDCSGAPGCAAQTTEWFLKPTRDTQHGTGTNPPSLFAVFLQVVSPRTEGTPPPPLEVVFDPSGRGKGWESLNLTRRKPPKGIWAPGEGREGELTHSLTPMTP